ncbi:FAD-dependent monooxygenase [Brevibacillus laterosporus]|uniref:FAD-dependent monooxygenase n=1 Tax=Brevibacillus laterosporus TaxID=1465 RepID=UPI0023E09537|nr:FAD-dependent monooxygenase [Brevibacillus laterosporus]
MYIGGELSLKILISGSGIAGLTLANCLLSYGYQPVVIEKASSFSIYRFGY